MVINNKNNKYIATIVFLILVSILTTIDNFALQTAVDGGLILSERVVYPDQFSNVTAIYFNSWTLLHHITSILINLDMSVVTISMLLMFVSTIFFSFGIFFIVYNLTKSLLLSLFLVCFTLVAKINFGNVDYPALIFSEHTYGMFSLSTFTFFVGLLFNKNFKFAGFVSILLLSFHLIVGLWVISLLTTITIYLNIFTNEQLLYKSYIKKFYKGACIGLIPTIISFTVYKFSTVIKNDYNKDDFQTYLKLWDHHRNIFEINYLYILLTIILVFLFYIIFKNYKKNDFYNKFLFLFIVAHCFFSLIIYLSYKIFPQYFPDLFIRAMITRVFLLHSIIGYSLIISFLYIILKININQNSKTKNLKIFSIALILIFIISINKYDEIPRYTENYKPKIIKRLNKFNKNLSNQLNFEEKIFWTKVKNFDSKGYFVTTFDSSEPTLKFANKPYIINAKFFDHLPYHPYTIDEVKIIIENIYGINFKEPPIKHWPEIRDDWISSIFESRSNEEWSELSQKYNLSGIIVPSNWEIKINEKIISEKYILYKLQ